MTVQQRNNVHIEGDGPATLILSHGFGCDQSMWKALSPHFIPHMRVITYDLVGAGQSDLAAYDRAKYSTLLGYADDLNAIIDDFGQGPVIIAGHSVSAMIGVLAELRQPGRIARLVMLGESPCYIDSDGYNGGFSQEDVLGLLSMIDENYLGWSSTMAPVLMGASGEPAMQEELASSFRRTNAEIARHFARVIFLSDHREDVKGLNVPTLILQSRVDPVVPVAVGEYLERVMPSSQLVLVDNMGHYPQLSASSACAAAMDGFFARLGLGRE
ncbi:alpha/beta hydrolase [Pseudomonas juntendi]|uniref:alpha/beta fold hydrolase n=1 Tax=Pseudomonas juntendi TaxID=2666183 RepID=UPI001FFDA751|nr:alpha/beta hydrolase [Pseudomonas juntendi]MCK2114164.1 alpha/beta hydrolase [Pseudomonas juntendi]